MMIASLIESPCTVTSPDSVTSNIGPTVCLSDVLTIAKDRWFKVCELECLLSASTTPLQISTHTLRQPPKSGTVLLFDRSVTRNYKTDGHRWVKKRNSMKVREDRVKLRRNGRDRISGFYAHSEDVKSLHRRSYHLLDIDSGVTEFPPGKGGVYPSLVLVHYLDTASELEKLATSDSGLGRKRKRVVSDDVNSSRIKVEQDEDKEMRSRDEESDVASGLYNRRRLLDGVQNRMLMRLNALESIRKTRLEECLPTSQSADWNVRKQGQMRAEEVCSSDVLSKQQADEAQVHDDIDDDTLRMLQSLGSSSVGVDKRVHEHQGSIQGQIMHGDASTAERNASVSSPRSFEADFDVLWAYLCYEFDGTVSIAMLVC